MSESRTYLPPPWWRQTLGMYLVELGWAIRYGTVLRDRWVWWTTMARELVIMLIPTTLKNYIKRRARGW